MTKKDRENKLADLIGGMLAKEKREDWQKAKELLDEAGVERKARQSKAITIKEIDLMTAAETIAGAILKALEQHGITLAAAESGEADVQTPEEVEEIAIEATMDAVEELAASEEEKQDDEEEEPEEEEEIKALTQNIKSLTDVVAQSLEDQGDMSKAIVLLAEAVPALKGEIDDLKAIVNDRPRQASKANETAFENDEIKAEAKKSLEGEMRFLGLRVKEQPE